MRKYQIIYADPPWSYKVWTEDKTAAQGCAKRYYQTMPVEEICRLPIKQLTGDDCKLFLWATPPCLPEALRVMEAWGFEYKTIAFAWVKTNKRFHPEQAMFLPADSIDRFYGIGHWTASNIELCLGGLVPNGRLDRQTKDISQIVIANRREHSRKPDEVRDKIVRLCGDLPRMELFARQRVEGWDCWGNEVESDVDLTELV